MSAVRVWYCSYIQGDSGPSEACPPDRQARLIESLRQEGLNLSSLDHCSPGVPGVVFFDAIDQSLCDFLREVSRNGSERVLAIAVPHATLDSRDAWRLLEAGASDAFAWDHATNPAKTIAARFERWDRIDGLVRSPVVQNNLIGRSSAWTSVLRQVVEVAHFTDASILITGESGTGKELLARLIHTLDPRPTKRDLVVLDCTTIVPELSGSEFFGHERGAFTGAIAERDGVFALADGGTLFLDEVGELPPGLQAQLLRVVQEGTYKRVGGNTWRRTMFRLVCATNKNLRHEVARGAFRSDLYYRIASWEFTLPPLRERADDILPLTAHFLQQLRPNASPTLDAPVREYLLTREYPGNVRDLKQLVTRISHRYVGSGQLTIGDIPPEDRPEAGITLNGWPDAAFEQSIRRALALGLKLKDIGSRAQDLAIRIAVDEEGSVKDAAQRLGVTDRALQMRRAARRSKESGVPDESGPTST